VAHFYLSDDASAATEGGTLTVAGSEARHAITVGRLAAGERMRVGDGRGLIAHGVVSSVGSDRFDLHVESTHFDDEPSPQLWLAQALAKADRDELAIQAATELGVDGVIPWAATRSIVKWEGTKVTKHEQRWGSILREASKQSVRSRIPSLRPLASTGMLAALGDEFQILVLEPTAKTPLRSFAMDGRDVLVVVGPEGGIAPSELARLLDSGAVGVSLGSTILRTSTAGPAAIAVLNSALGRW
jgi:16S rRNA (uracil1498-N3)-methyltransferase